MGVTQLPNKQIAPLTNPSATYGCSGPSTRAFNSGYTANQGELVYLDSSATWQKTDANTLAQYNGLLGIVLEAKTSGQAMLVALPGSMVNMGDYSFTIGSPIYMSESPGIITHTQPTTTDAAVRVIGWAIGANNIFFFPSPNYITRI